MAPAIDWDKLTFSLNPAKTMYSATCKAGGAWDEGQFLPFGPISISPAAGVLNYGQGIFEGLKANRTKAGKLVLFRPLENGKRMAEGAKRICLSEFPPEKFVEVVKELVRQNADFVPPYGKGSLYIRPCLWGTGAMLGVAPAPEYTFLIYVSPVGPYFKSGWTPIKLEITEEFHRSAAKGTGGAKYIGNYAGGMLPAKLTKAKGYSEVIYLDGKHDRYIEEVGAANFFCVMEGKVVTPKTGSILSGVTRKSIIQLAREVLKLEVAEKNVSVEEALSADEAFCTGTAAVVAPIGSIAYQGRETVFNGGKPGEVTRKLYDLLTSLQLQERDDPFGWVVPVN